MRLVLASQSPRRHQLLQEAGFDFETVLVDKGVRGVGNSKLFGYKKKKKTTQKSVEKIAV